MDEIEKALAEVPDKTYFRIGEVARIAGVKPYVLRYWETEFKGLAPPKSRSNQRMYRRKDIERILLVKQLLYKERFTIEGARKRIATVIRGERQEGAKPSRADTFGRLRRDLEGVRELLG